MSDPSSVNVPRSTKRPCRESEHLWCDVEGRCLNCDAPLCRCIETKATGEIDTTLCRIHSTPPLPVSDEAEAAWDAWSPTVTWASNTRGAYTAFLAGFRAARGEDA